MFFIIFSLFKRNQAYDARIQLAVLEYSSHLEIEKAVNKEGDITCAHKFRKQSKKRDETATLVKNSINTYPAYLRKRRIKKIIGMICLEMTSTSTHRILD